MLCSMMLQATASRSCSECRTKQLGSFSRLQDEPTPERCCGRYSPFSRELTKKWLCWRSVSAAHRRRHTSGHLMQDRQHNHNLQSATTTLCQPSTTRLVKRAYRYSAAAVWNSLPKTIVTSDSVTVFKSRLKTFLFSRAFCLPFSQ